MTQSVGINQDYTPDCDPLATPSPHVHIPFELPIGRFSMEAEQDQADSDSMVVKDDATTLPLSVATADLHGTLHPDDPHQPECPLPPTGEDAARALPLSVDTVDLHGALHPDDPQQPESPWPPAGEDAARALPLSVVTVDLHGALHPDDPQQPDCPLPLTGEDAARAFGTVSSLSGSRHSCTPSIIPTKSGRPGTATSDLSLPGFLRAYGYTYQSEASDFAGTVRANPSEKADAIYWAPMQGCLQTPPHTPFEQQHTSNSYNECANHEIFDAGHHAGIHHEFEEMLAGMEATQLKECPGNTFSHEEEVLMQEIIETA